MSTLRSQSITDTSGDYISTPKEIYSGCAKAWCRFNGRGTLAAQASFNIGTITDNGTGRYNFQFTNPISGFHAICGSGGNRTATTKQAGDVDMDGLRNGGTPKEERSLSPPLMTQSSKFIPESKQSDDVIEEEVQWYAPAGTSVECAHGLGCRIKGRL